MAGPSANYFLRVRTWLAEIVGPDKKPIHCHKLLLGYYSQFFDAALYGQSNEGRAGSIDLPDEKPDAISAFLTWVYTGQIQSKTMGAEELWVLGDSLLSPTFCNDVMYLIFDIYGYGSSWLNAESADTAYDQTPKASALRKFVGDLMNAHGPLCPRAIEDEKERTKDGGYERDWYAVIERGGELVLQMAKVRGFKDDEFIKRGGNPYNIWGKEQYILYIELSPVEGFVQSKMGS